MTLMPMDGFKPNEMEWLILEGDGTDYSPREEKWIDDKIDTSEIYPVDVSYGIREYTLAVFFHSSVTPAFSLTLPNHVPLRRGLEFMSKISEDIEA